MLLQYLFGGGPDTSHGGRNAHVRHPCHPSDADGVFSKALRTRFVYASLTQKPPSATTRARSIDDPACVLPRSPISAQQLREHDRAAKTLKRRIVQNAAPSGA